MGRLLSAAPILRAAQGRQTARPRSRRPPAEGWMSSCEQTPPQLGQQAPHHTLQYIAQNCTRESSLHPGLVRFVLRKARFAT